MYETTTSIGLSELLFKLFNKTRYDFVYVSFGGKKNEDKVSFIYPNRGLMMDCNSEYQMVPKFIRKKSNNDKVLIIVIDDFHMVDLKKTNVSILGSIEKQHNKIQTILVDHTITLESIHKYVAAILECLSYHGIDNSQFILTNFICFKQPNVIQTTFEKNLPDIIQKLLDSTYVDYQTCFYQWYGYAYYTYNYTYCYKQYNIHRLMSIRQLQTFMNKSLFVSCLATTNENVVATFINHFHKDSGKKWEKFIENSMCLHI